MAGTKMQQRLGTRAAIYARVSDRSQAEEDKTSISEQLSDREMTIVVRYQEMGRGWSKKRPEFQRMLADAKKGRFDTIFCWKADRLSWGYTPQPPSETHRIDIEAVMDAIDMKTFGLRACECFEVPLWLSITLVMGVRPWELTELRVS